DRRGDGREAEPCDPAALAGDGRAGEDPPAADRRGGRVDPEERGRVCAEDPSLPGRGGAVTVNARRTCFVFLSAFPFVSLAIVAPRSLRTPGLQQGLGGVVCALGGIAAW